MVLIVNVIFRTRAKIVFMIVIWLCIYGKRTIKIPTPLHAPERNDSLIFIVCKIIGLFTYPIYSALSLPVYDNTFIVCTPIVCGYNLFRYDGKIKNKRFWRFLLFYAVLQFIYLYTYNNIICMCRLGS